MVLGMFHDSAQGGGIDVGYAPLALFSCACLPKYQGTDCGHNNTGCLGYDYMFKKVL
jgi:hypothetical protein